METLATDRLVLPNGRAPGGLGLVQELVNTSTRPAESGSHVPDLLIAADPANSWLRAALRQWSEATAQPAPGLALEASDLGPLRRVRESVRSLAGPGAGSQPVQLGPVSLAIHLDDTGQMRYSTSATGWRGVTALVAGEILLAQQSGAWQRFRACPYPACGVAFYDGTRNNNRVWHDVRTCGNRTNLAAARNRRRA